MNPNRHPFSIVAMLASITFFLCSTLGAQEVTVSMSNLGNAPVDYFWVDEQGNEVHYGTIPAKATIEQPTHPNHRWRFKANNQVLSEYVAVDALAQGVNIPGRPMTGGPSNANSKGAAEQPRTNNPRNPGRGGKGNAGGNRGRNRPLDFDAPNLGAINRAILEATNAMRADNGLPPLRASNQLKKAAQMHADDMVKHNFFSHGNPVDPSRGTMEQRIAMTGYRSGNIAENIAMSFGLQYEAGSAVGFGGPGVFLENGQPIPPHTARSLAQALVEDWMKSPPHRANLLGPYTEMGAGVAFYTNAGFNQMPSVKACQVFGSSN